MPAVIRRADVSDIDHLAAIENRVFPGDRLSRRSLRRHIASDGALMLVAEAQGRPVGYALVLLRRGSATARLYSIAVEPAAAPRGTGRALLAAAERQAALRGAEALRLEVRADNARAVELYERAGYRGTGRRAGYYEDGADALLYRRELRDGATVAR